MVNTNSAYKMTASISTEGGKLKMGEPCLYRSKQYWFICKLYDREIKKTTYLLIDAWGSVKSVSDKKAINAGIVAVLDGQLDIYDVDINSPELDHEEAMAI